MLKSPQFWKSAAKHTGSFLQGAGGALGGGESGYLNVSRQRGRYGSAPPPSWMQGVQQFLNMQAARQNQNFPLQ
jgi:hypothetical protein